MGLKDRLVRQRSARMPSNDESDSTGSTLPSPGKASITGIGAKILSSLRLERSRHGQGAPRLTAGPHMHPCDGAKSVRESLSGKEGEVPPTTRTDPSRWTSLWRVTSRKPDIASQRERVSLAKGFTPAVAAGGGGSITAANVGAAVDSLSRATMFDTFVSTVPAFERTRHRVLPVVSQKFVSHLPGTVVRDDHIAFTVPPSWIATRGDYCFILSTDICVGFILATEAASASASLCDTSQLVILDHLEPMASPTFDANCNVLVVEYRGPGSGRGLALIEPDEGQGAVVFGLAGPKTHAEFLRDTEKNLLSTAYVVTPPASSKDISPSSGRAPPSPNPETTYCSIV